MNSLPTLPNLPCPAAGTQLPLVGKVGDSAAAQRLDDLVWVLETISDLVPETE